MFPSAKVKNLIIGLLAILAAFAIYYYLRQYRETAPSPLAENLPVSQEEELALETQVGVKIPEDAEKTKLTDISGGQSSGIATRKFDAGKFEHSIIANLPDPKEDEFYQGWLAKGEETISTGRMEEKKGGWVLEYTSEEDKSDYHQTMVTLEEKDDDQPEEKILEGRF